MRTHTDQDHIGDLATVAKAIPIAEIWTTPGSLKKPSFKKTLEGVGVPVHLVKSGDTLSIYDSTLTVISSHEGKSGENDDSIVLYGTLLGKRFLLTGDSEETGEKELVARYPHLAVDILKVGHHGSKGSTSTDLLEATKPKLALISVGANNRYHQPNQETLDRLEAEGVTIYRTDQRGAIRLRGRKSWRLETVR